MMQFPESILILGSALVLSLASNPNPCQKFGASAAGINHDLVRSDFSHAQMRGPQRARRFEKYGTVSSNQEKARLDAFARELQSDPRAVGYVIVFGKKGRPASEALKRAKKTKSYLVDYNRTSNKIFMVTSCFRPQVEYELWIVPAGGSRPSSCAGPAKE